MGSSFTLHCSGGSRSPLELSALPNSSQDPVLFYIFIVFFQWCPVIDGLAGLVNARQKICSDSGAKSQRVNKGSN